MRLLIPYQTELKTSYRKYVYWSIGFFDEPREVVHITSCKATDNTFDCHIAVHSWGELSLNDSDTDICVAF